jgi:hypothetical protein
VTLNSGCYDTTSSPGRMLVQPGAGAAQTTLTITAH